MTRHRTTTITVVLFLALAALHLFITDQPDLPCLLGNRNVAIFDLWSIQHFLSGIIIAALLAKFFVKSKSLAIGEYILVILIIAMSWEAMELAMEKGVVGQIVSHWKDNHEHWGNRLIGDLLMVVLGGLLGRKYSWTWKIATIPAALWLILNAISPTNIFIQERIMNRVEAETGARNSEIILRDGP
ncbi:MAG: hypothetical protein U9M92_02180 [Patescibacteria group bacterium]|nr:hypothetical protein [Patescibacteria group bacterium]